MHIEIQNISKRYGRSVALDDLSMTFSQDQVLVVLGGSGSGKSTLLKVIAGLILPDEGQILIDRQKLILKEKELRQHRQNVGIVFQQFNLFPHLTAFQNLTLPLIYVQNYSPDEAENWALELLNRFDLLEHAHKKPAELSGGQNQRTAILRAVAIRPKILLFDEPTSALDPIMAAEVLALITELKKESRHFILVTHHVHFAKSIADKIGFMANGRLVELTDSKEFFKNPSSDEAKAYLQKVLMD